MTIGALSRRAPHLPRRPELASDGLASLAASGWCELNFWRCRQAHCMVSAAGWLGLSLVAFAGAGLGHSLIYGDEQLIFSAYSWRRWLSRVSGTSRRAPTSSAAPHEARTPEATWIS